MAVRWYMFCLAAAAGLLLPVPFFLSASETLQVVNRIESSKPLKMVKDATLSTVSYLTGNCPAVDAVGEVTLCLGAEANDSANHEVWDQAAWVTKHVLMRSIDDAFEVKKLAQARFTYPAAAGFGNWQVRVSPSSPDLARSGWYLPPTTEDLLQDCAENVEGEAVFFRGFFFKKFQYGHVLHDLLPVLVWMSTSHPEARIVLELDTQKNIQKFLAWFDPELYQRTSFVQSEQVVCASSLWVVVPKAPSPHGLRIPALFNHLRRHIAHVQPTYNATRVVYTLRMSSTAGHGRLLTTEHSQEVVQIAKDALSRHGMSSEIVVFNGTSDGKKAASYEEQHRLFSSAILVFGPHGTAFLKYPLDALCHPYGGNRVHLWRPLSEGPWLRPAGRQRPLGYLLQLGRKHLLGVACREHEAFFLLIG